MVYSLAASTLTVAAPLGCDAATAERAEPTAATTRRPSDVLVTGTDGEMLVLEVTEANKVVVRLPRVEVGQGVTTAVAMMIAEELDARLADVDIPLADARAKGNQFTGGSSSVSSLYGPARALAALARAKLVTAAARRWNLPARSLRTRNTKVIAPDGRSATFGSLTASAARIRRPAVSSKPKLASRHRVIGRPTTRFDALDIVTGKAEYAGDLAVAGAKPTVMARPPTLGGKLVSVDSRVARAMPGVHAVVKVAGGVAVVAESFHHAFKARDALRITWAPGPLASLSDVAIRSRLWAAVPRLGNPPRGSAQTEGEFEFAFVSHAPMEVLTAVADVLLPAGPDHGRGGPAEEDAPTDGRRHRRHRERLPLRYLLPDPRSDQEGCGERLTAGHGGQGVVFGGVMDLLRRGCPGTPSRLVLLSGLSAACPHTPEAPAPAITQVLHSAAQPA